MASPATEYVEPDPKTVEAVNTWSNRITRAKAINKNRFETVLKTQRGYVAGEQHDDGQAGLVRTNLIFSSIATVLPHVYAKNPDVSVFLTDAVPKAQYEAFKKFASTMERVLHNLLIEAGKLKRRMKGATRSTMTTGVGWLKVIFQSDISTDPIVTARIQDTQDNLRRIQYLLKEVQDELTPDLEAKKLELSTQIEALQAKAEVRTVRGFVIDRVLTEDIMILDEAVKEFDYYVEASALAHRVWYTDDSYKEAFGHDVPQSATKHTPDEAGQGFQMWSQQADQGNAAKPQNFYAVWEIWHRRSNTIYTLCEGAKQWCRDPFVPKRQGKRWYPFFALGFNLIDGRWWPLSDVDLLRTLQDEYNTTRTNYAEHRRASIPVQVVRAGGNLTPEDVKRIEQRKINQIIAIEGEPGRPLTDDIADLDAPKLDPNVYDTSPIRQDIDMVMGTSEAARSSITTPKTATESQILESSLMSRTAERQDSIEELMDDMCNFAAEIALQELSLQEVIEIAGEDSVWPTLDKEHVWRMVKIRIKAGSTGKPNRIREQEQWVKLLPEIQNAMKQVAELRMAGQFEMAQATLELLGETMRRFDEYIDLDRFIPPQDGNVKEQIGQQLQALTVQNQQLQEQSAQVQAELAKCQQDLDAARRGEQAKVVENIGKAQETEGRLANERRAKDIEAQNKKQLERDRLNNEYSLQDKKQRDSTALEMRKQADAKELKTLELESAERLAKLQAGLERVAAAEAADQKEDAAGGEGETKKAGEDMGALLKGMQALLKELVAASSKPRIVKVQRNGPAPEGAMQSLEIQ